jgi:hypothetical protein
VTTQALRKLVNEYRAKLRDMGARAEKATSAGRTREEFFALSTDGPNLLWLLDRMEPLIFSDRVARAMQTLGFVQSGLLKLGAYTLEEMVQHSKALDAVELPPPPGIETVPAKVMLSFACAACGGVVARLDRSAWLPKGVAVTALALPPFDPDGRLSGLTPYGIHVTYRIENVEWDYGDQTANVYLVPTLLHPDLSDESVALAFSLLRAAGWTYLDDKSRDWEPRWRVHVARARAAAEFKKKKKKRRPDDGGPPPGESGAGAPD